MALHRLPSGRLIGPRGVLYKVRGGPHKFGLKSQQGRYRTRRRRQAAPTPRSRAAVVNRFRG